MAPPSDAARLRASTAAALGLLARFPETPLVGCRTRQRRSHSHPYCRGDDKYRALVGSELAWHGFAVNSFANGDALLCSPDAAAEADVIALGWRLSSISGIDLLLQLRQRDVIVQLVFLTSHVQPANEQLAFECGARRGSGQTASFLGGTTTTGAVLPDTIKPRS